MDRDRLLLQLTQYRKAMAALADAIASDDGDKKSRDSILLSFVFTFEMAWKSLKTALALRGLKAFLYASVFAAPTGKQNTFAAHNLPSLMLQVVRENASPRNLANAFEAKLQRPEGLVAQSIERLNQEAARQERIFGQGGRSRFVLNAEPPSEKSEKLDAFGEAFGSVDALIEATLRDAEAALKRPVQSHER